MLFIIRYICIRPASVCVCVPIYISVYSDICQAIVDWNWNKNGWLDEVWWMDNLWWYWFLLLHSLLLLVLFSLLLCFLPYLFSLSWSVLVFCCCCCCCSSHSAQHRSSLQIMIFSVVDFSVALPLDVSLL